MEFVKRNFKIISILLLLVWSITNIFSFKPSDKLTEADKKDSIFSFANISAFNQLSLGLDLVGGSQFEFQALT